MSTSHFNNTADSFPPASHQYAAPPITVTSTGESDPIPIAPVSARQRTSKTNSESMGAKSKRSKKQGKSWLLDMPPELQSMIASKLDAVSVCNLKLVCKSIDTWTKGPIKLSSSEWRQFHSMFETMARKHRKLQTLGCSDCKKFLDRGLFGDGAAARNLRNKSRMCISCTIQKGSKRLFKVNGKTLFGCRGCLKAKSMEEEEGKCPVDNVHWYEDLPRNDTGSFDASRGFRWCHDCWTAVKNYRSLDLSP